MSIADDLERLRQLHASGDLSDDEYAQAKAAALGQSQRPPNTGHVGSYSEPDYGAQRQDDWQAPGAGYFESDARAGGPGWPDRSQSRARNSMSGWLSENEWAMVLHLSQFAGYIAPLLGFVVPILIWQILKEDLPSLDRHGRIVMNWLISSLLYAVLCVILSFALVGIPLLVILAVLAIVFPIIAALKANSGEEWVYPMSIGFFFLGDSRTFDDDRDDDAWE